MPIPSPNKGESEEDFISRCMANSTMVSEYPDEKQRYAVCQSQWDSSGKSEALDGLYDELDTDIMDM